ncbi:MAG: hypothetical protein ACRDF4_01985, partial [Rhabdochlamydiaceae bacterium]
SNGALAVLYSDTGGTNQRFTTLGTWSIETCTPGGIGSDCQGPTAPATWSTPVITASSYYPDHSSASAIGSTVYFAGPNATAVSSWSFAYGNSATSQAFQIDSGVSGSAAPVSISEDGTGSVLGTGNSLAVIYGSGTNLYLSTSTTDISWSLGQTISTSESSLLGVSSTYSGTQEGAIWSTSAASPFTIRFGGVNTQAFNPNLIAPSTVSTSTTDTATSSTNQNKLFYDLGLWWDFFSTGSEIDYSTASDGFSWGAPTSLITSTTGDTLGSDFSVTLSGDTAYWVLSSGDSNANFVYDSGTLASTGTITLGTSATEPTSTGYLTFGPVSIETDLAGNTWVAMTTLQAGTNYNVEVYEHASGSANNAGWTTNIAPSSLPTLTPTADSTIVAPNSGPGALLIVEVSGATGTGAISIYSTTVASGWTVSTWSASVSPASNYALASSSETVAGSTLAFAGLASSSTGQTSGSLKFWTFVLGGSATSQETTIESSSEDWQAALGSFGNTLFLFDANNSAINYYYTSNLGYTWSPRATATTYEPSITGMSAAAGGTMAVTWTSGNVANYDIRFGSLSSLTVNNNSGFAVHLTSLFISNPNTNSIVKYYVSNSTNLFDYWINPGASASVAFTFTWATSTSYGVAIGTSSGVVDSDAFISPA